MKKMYIAGKVTGEPQRATIHKFVEAETTARKLGYNPVNPLDFVPAFSRKEEQTEEVWRDAMKECLPKLLDCDAIILCHDYSSSRGATVEHYLAVKMNIPRIYLNYEGKVIKSTNENVKLAEAV